MRIGRASALFTLPTDAYRAGNFAASRFAIYDPDPGLDGFNRQPFPNKIIQPSRISPVALNIL